MATVTALPKADLAMIGARNADYGRRAFSKENGVRRVADVLVRAHGNGIEAAVLTPTPKPPRRQRCKAPDGLIFLTSESHV